MYLYPEDINTKLEFDKILELLSKECIGQKAKERSLRIQLFNSKKRIVRSLEEVAEFSESFESGNQLMLNDYSNIDEDIYLLRKQKYVLDTEQHLRVFEVIKTINAIYYHFEEEDIAKQYPRLNEIASQIVNNSELFKAYAKVFDEEGGIRPNASAELAAISKTIRGKEMEIERNFARTLDGYKKQNLLADAAESFKNGRRVLSVNAENKRKVKGVIHDESATGKTVFIEPAELVELNNFLFELFVERKKEVYRILKNLSDFIRPYCDDFDLWQKIIVRYDLIRAKAKLALKYNGRVVQVSDDLEIELKEATHPLLKIINDKLTKETVPFSLRLNEEKRILLISGPNAGGKSVTMKAVGLIQMMFQAGLLIPASADSKMGIFKSLLVDIGDQQSLEEDLSTYSSRLLNMKRFLKKANSESLFLIDEFGSGTDPQAGGAIAESILKQLLKQKSFGVITTHYSNIKMFGVKNKEILNGAMLFDKKTLSPKYVLSVGKPGSSYAFEIATKIGLPNHLLDYAKKKAGKHAQAIDELLIQLQEEKKTLINKLKEAENEQKGLERLIKNYQTMSEELNFRRKKLKMKEKDMELKSIAKVDKQLQAMIRKVTEEKNADKAKKMSNEFRSKKKNIENQLIDLNSEINAQNSVSIDRAFEPGDHVKLNGGGESGEVIHISDGIAKIQMGIMTLEVPLTELVPAKENIVVNRTKSVKSSLSVARGDIKSKLDLRGYTKNDAAYFLQDFLDKALLSNHTYFEILHGKGNGVLRKFVLSKLKEYKDIRNIRHPEEEYGGLGITKFEI